MTTTTLSASEYRKKKLPGRDETQMLVAVNSRFEDMGARRIHIMPDLDEPILIRERKKITGMHVPSVSHANDCDLLEEYGCELARPLWVRPPFILPASWAPWRLEPGQSYMLASGDWSTPYPASTSMQKTWEWHLENLPANPAPFLPHALPDSAKGASSGDMQEINVRLWHDARGPGASARKAEIQALAIRVLMGGGSLDEYAPILPADRGDLQRQPLDEAMRLDVSAETIMSWHGWEEAIWAAILDDPDIDLFGLDEDESMNPHGTQNLFLESDNLLAMKRLMRGYKGKVKLTYADPPYNTGHKFVYDDSFRTHPNTGSPFSGQRHGNGTWRLCQIAPWVNVARLAPKRLTPVDDTMLHRPGGAAT